MDSDHEGQTAGQAHDPTQSLLPKVGVRINRGSSSGLRREGEPRYVSNVYNYVAKSDKKRWSSCRPRSFEVDWD